jgi:enoyl-CoA hydratase/carnithine racemase
MNESVRFEERSASNGAGIGVATLNSPSTLNSLSLEMAHLLDQRLQAWAADPSMALVVLQGAGDRAFCAGGDLQRLYRSMREAPAGDAWANSYAREFFEVEYRLDYRIHSFPKPLVCLGHGIVMGGGVGLMIGASHRVVTETTRFAMPEIGIGLFPDVGGTWLLDRMPGRAGLFLALTGAQLNAADACHVGVADHIMRQQDWPAFLNSLATQPWATAAAGDADPRAANDDALSRLLDAVACSEAAAPGPLQRNAALIDEICAGERLEDIYTRVAALAGNADPWLAKAAATMTAGSPGTARLAWSLQRRLHTQPLPEVFRAEYIAALACAAHGDFAEGIRALIIDKDRTPHWNPATLEQADDAWVRKFFEPPWPAGTAHPLADLGAHAPAGPESRRAQ